MVRAPRALGIASAPTGSCHLYEAEPSAHMVSATVVAGTGMQEQYKKIAR